MQARRDEVVQVYRGAVVDTKLLELVVAGVPMLGPQWDY